MEKKSGGFAPSFVRSSPASVKASEKFEAAVMIKARASDVAEKLFDRQTLAAAQQLSQGSLLELGASILRDSGQTVPTGKHDLANALIRASDSSFTTISLGGILGDSCRKIAAERFRTSPSTWRDLAMAVDVRDFHQHSVLRLDTDGGLHQLPPDGEIKHEGLLEAAFQVQTDTWAKMIRLTRKDLINDSLGAFGDIGGLFARDALLTVNDAFWKALLGGQTSGFFSTANKNLIASNALSVAGLSAAVTRMRSATDSTGRSLDLVPVNLVVPPALEFTARQLLSSMELCCDSTATGQSPNGNPFNQMNLGLVVEPRLGNPSFDGHSDTDWYLAAAPSDHAWIVGLGPAATPQVDFAGLTDIFNQLGLSWRVYIDFGVSPGEPLSMIKSEGT